MIPWSHASNRRPRHQDHRRQSRLQRRRRRPPRDRQVPGRDPWRHPLADRRARRRRRHHRRVLPHCRGRPMTTNATPDDPGDARRPGARAVQMERHPGDGPMTRPETLTRTPGGDPIETPELVADWDEAVRLLRAGGHRFTVNAWMILAPTVGDLMWMTPAEVLDRLACRFCDAPLSAVEVGDPMCDACLHMVHPDCKAFPVGARVRLTDGAMRIYYAR